MRRELQQTKEKLASTEQKLASAEQKLQELQGEVDLLRGKNLESMDKEALVQRKTDLEDIQCEAQRRVDDAILRREVEEEIPEGPFICPITRSLMKNPVMASDGHTYEHDAIREHIRRQGANAKSPKINLRLAHHDLTPNINLRQSIEEEIEKRMQEKKRKTQQEGSSSGKRKR